MGRFENMLGRATNFTLTAGGFRFEVGDDGDLLVQSTDWLAHRDLTVLTERHQEWGEYVPTPAGQDDRIGDLWLSDPDGEGYGAIIDRMFETIAADRAAGHVDGPGPLNVGDLKAEARVTRYYVNDADHARLAYVMDSFKENTTGDGETADGFDSPLDVKLAEAICQMLNGAQNMPNTTLSRLAADTTEAMTALARLQGLAPIEPAELFRMSPSELQELAEIADTLRGRLLNAATYKAVMSKAIGELLDAAEGVGA